MLGRRYDDIESFRVNDELERVFDDDRLAIDQLDRDRSEGRSALQLTQHPHMRLFFLVVRLIHRSDRQRLGTGLRIAIVTQTAGPNASNSAEPGPRAEKRRIIGRRRAPDPRSNSAYVLSPMVEMLR